MSYITVAKELKKNIQIMTSTFENNNLQVLNIACKPYNDDDGDLKVYVELAAINGSSIPCSMLDVKINLYDEDGELYISESTRIFEEDFNGYDTIEIDVYDDSHPLDVATRGRLFIARC